MASLVVPCMAKDHNGEISFGPFGREAASVGTPSSPVHAASGIHVALPAAWASDDAFARQQPPLDLLHPSHSRRSVDEFSCVLHAAFYHRGGALGSSPCLQSFLGNGRCEYWSLCASSSASRAQAVLQEASRQAFISTIAISGRVCARPDRVGSPPTCRAARRWSRRTCRRGCHRRAAERTARQRSLEVPRAEAERPDGARAALLGGSDDAERARGLGHRVG